MKIDKTGNPKIDKNGNRIPLNSDFEKFNIIYGENGNGKSTLVNIFKSISSNSEVHLPKNWDRELESRKIITVTDQGEIIFDENQKCLSNIFKSKIIVLDRDFVTNYVHSGQRTNQHDKNTGQLILFLGDFHSYKSQLDKLVVLNDDIKKKQDTLTSNCKIKKNELTENINNLENAFDFYKEISTSKPEELAQKKIELNNKKVETEKYITLLRNSEAIISFKNLFQKIENPLKVTPQQGRTSLNFSISKGTLEIIQKIKDKGSFVFEGFKIVKNDTLKICPFCEQSILSSDGGYLQIIKNYQSIFDEEFIKLQNTTKEKLSDYKSSLQSINSNVEPQNNTSLLAKYKSLFDSDCTHAI